MRSAFSDTNTYMYIFLATMAAQKSRELCVGLHLNLQWEFLRNFNNMINTNMI